MTFPFLASPVAVLVGVQQLFKAAAPVADSVA